MPWSTGLLTGVTFLPLLSFFGTGKIFLLYAACCFLSIWFTTKKVIETSGRTLEQIEADLHHRVHHLEEEKA